MKKLNSLELQLEDFKSVKSSDLQRTEQWLQDRNGKWTGSENKDLMSVGRATGKLPWTDAAKIVDFGKGAETHVFIVGKRRSTDILEMELSAKQLDYGKENEPKLIEQLIKDGIITDFEERGLEYFPNYSNGGASVDGIAIYKGRKVALELKCTTSWSGYKNRMYEPVNEKHQDFWQHQSEMLAVGLHELLYVVAEPMTTERYEIQIVKASKIHQKALIDRCKIADKAIELWNKHSYSDALMLACKEYNQQEEIEEKCVYSNIQEKEEIKNNSINLETPF